MLKIGDMVKIIKPSSVKVNKLSNHDNNELKREYIEIGTICRIVEIYSEEGTNKYFYGLVPVKRPRDMSFYYYDDEFESGHLEWVKN